METEKHRQWLRGLKAGDTVIVEIKEFIMPRRPRRLKLLKVRARTEYGISIETRDRPNLYWATTGRAAGSDGERRILEPTPKLRTEWEKQGGNNG